VVSLMLDGGGLACVHVVNLDESGREVLPCSNGFAQCLHSVQRRGSIGFGRCDLGGLCGVGHVGGRAQRVYPASIPSVALKQT
jgi:hypothetical protein